MKFLDREGNGSDAKYFNTPAAARYLDGRSPRYIGGILGMLNDRLFKFWHDLPTALPTGRPERNQTWAEGGIRGALRRTAQARTVHGGRWPGSPGLILKHSRGSLIFPHLKLFVTLAAQPACSASSAPRSTRILGAFRSICRR